MPRNRSARLALLGSSAQRPATAAYPSRSSGPLKRRIVLGVLVAISLVLITVYFRESGGGVVHGLQSTGSTVLHPFEVAATRVARPFQDLYDYVRGLTNAKAERDRLRAENDRLRQQLIQLRSADRQNGELRRELGYVSGPTFPSGYRHLTAAIVSKPESQFDQQFVVAVGRSEGVAKDDPVVTADGLVGKVTKVVAHQSQVTMLTDEGSAVSAVDANTGAEGIVKHGQGPGATLFLDQVPLSAHVEQNDKIVTSGWKNGRLTSIFPRGIAIGVVSSVSFPSNALFASVQVTPYVPFSALDSVTVLVPKGSAGKP